MRSTFAMMVLAAALVAAPAEAARRCVLPDGSTAYVVGSCPNEKKPQATNVDAAWAASPAAQAFNQSSAPRDEKPADAPAAQRASAEPSRQP